MASLKDISWIFKISRHSNQSSQQNWLASILSLARTLSRPQTHARCDLNRITVCSSVCFAMSAEQCQRFGFCHGNRNSCLRHLNSNIPSLRWLQGWCLWIILRPMGPLEVWTWSTTFANATQRYRVDTNDTHYGIIWPMGKTVAPTFVHCKELQVSDGIRSI